MTDKTNPDGFPKHEAPIDGSLFGARTTERTTLPMESGADAEGNGVRRRPRGVAFNRHYTRDGVNPFDAVEWTLRTAVIATDKGEVLFRQDNCEIPAEWTQMAANVVVSKYFRGGLGSPDREHSVRQLVGRVANTIADWGLKDGTSSRRGRRDLSRRADPHAGQPAGVVQLAGVVQRRRREDAAVLGLLHQLRRGHDGVDPRPGQDRGPAVQVRLGHRQQPLGAALQRARAVDRRRQASGPVSFMRGFDAFAGVIKSAARRAAPRRWSSSTPTIPDIEEFIDCKVNEEKKAWALIDSGYDGSFNGEAYLGVLPERQQLRSA
jgi:ribonucleoside-diphosphate reductase alpha chain